MKKSFLVIITGVISLLIGCDQGTSTLGGAAIGTAAGAGLGYVIGGGSAGGTAIGAVLGGLTGAAIGSNEGAKQEARERAYERQSQEHQCAATTTVICSPRPAPRPTCDRVYVEKTTCYRPDPCMERELARRERMIEARERAIRSERRRLDCDSTYYSRSTPCQTEYYYEEVCR